MTEEDIETVNVIKSSTEIPQVLKEEKVKQPVIYLSGKIKGKERKVVLLGEVHIATKGEERAASRILPYFTHIGCEGVDVRGFIEGKLFFLFMRYIISPLVAIIFFLERRSKNYKSFRQTAREYQESGSKTNKVMSLEKGWKPSIRLRLFFIVFPILIFRNMLSMATDTVRIASDQGAGVALLNIVFLFVLVELSIRIPILKDVIKYLAILVLDLIFDLGPSRNRYMTKKIVTAFNKKKTIREIIALSGSAHTRPMAKILKNKYGFVETGSYEPEGF